MELIRDFQRAWVCLGIRCGQTHTGLITNISVSGAQVRGIAPPPGEYLVEIPLAPGTTLRLRAENIWVKDAHFGMKFLELSKRELFLLRALVWAHRREDLE
ncbi:MAG TPA: PilZ domain-containing protein [Bdellovibrionota bacterium]|jgi:hypothetical protein|nr:PilZ domain-containing protein [Bdellovibrionota bacterium]